MKAILLIVAILVSMLVSPVNIFAKGHGHGNGHGHHHGYGHGCGHNMFTSNISEMDKNADQQISFDEFKNFRIKDLRTAFDMLDTSKDGLLDEAEWNEFIRVHSGK